MNIRTNKKSQLNQRRNIIITIISTETKGGIYDNINKSIREQVSFALSGCNEYHFHTNLQ